MDKAVCIVCGRPASFFVCEVNANTGQTLSKQFCAEHEPGNLNSAHVLEEALIEQVTSLHASKPLREVRLQFTIKGRSADIIQLEEMFPRMLERGGRLPSGDLETEVLICFSPWYSLEAARLNARESAAAVLDLCAAHHCKCVGHGVEGNWAAAKDEF